MSHSSDASPSDLPGDPPDAPLHPDPELAASLIFEPVIRKIQRHDGWTADLQCEFIRRLAISGSPQRACIEMGKSSTGIEALYKNPLADSFRAAWDQAVRIGRRARGIDVGPPHLGPMPGITRRHERGLPPPARGRGRWPDPEPAEPDESEEAKLAIVERLLTKWLLKVQQEREARLGGKIATADFYLRQVTFIEVAFDLMVHEGLGEDPFDMLKQLRRGGAGLTHIAETPFSQMLDDQRRALWAMMAGEEPTIHPPERYFDAKSDHSLQPLQSLGPASDPPPGVDVEAWSAMDVAGQKDVLAEVYRKEAAAQVEWERGSAEAKPASSHRKSQSGGLASDGSERA